MKSTENSKDQFVELAQVICVSVLCVSLCVCVRVCLSVFACLSASLCVHVCLCV